VVRRNVIRSGKAHNRSILIAKLGDIRTVAPRNVYQSLSPLVLFASFY
jgi:hypothetical protein